MSMRPLTLALASACIFVASCSSTKPPPVAADALDGLLLSPFEVEIAMSADELTVSETYTGMFDDSATVPDKDCRFNFPSETSVYNGSGWIAVRRQNLREPVGHEVWQAVVSFPSANDAARFFSASAQRGWPACSNRQYHYIDPGKPDKVWTMGPIANISDTLSTTDTLEGTNGWACQRALTVSNNIAIDVEACSANPAGAAVNIAHQIAAKVAKL
jgi:hypothetical protein